MGAAQARLIEWVGRRSTLVLCGEWNFLEGSWNEARTVRVVFPWAFERVIYCMLR